MKHTDVLREIARRWGTLDKKGQAPYVVLAMEAKKEYQAELAEYHQSEEYAQYTAEKEAFMDKRKAEKRKARQAEKAMRPKKARRASSSKSRSRSRSAKRVSKLRRRSAKR